jgi:hypothetical protein
MQIILSQQCESLTGSLGKGFGYYITKSKKGYFSKRQAKGLVPPDGHWRFILTCARLAQNKLHIADIRVSGLELLQALLEAYHDAPSDLDFDRDYSAREVLSLNETLSLSIASASDADI